MSILNLDFLFRPRSIALIGADKAPASGGAVIARNLLKSGFRGPIMPISQHRAIEGVLAYPSVDALPEPADLAVLATAAELAPELIDDLGRRGTRAAMVMSGGFGEGGDARGLALRAALLEAARRHDLRIVGPNCSGLLAPPVGLNASLAAATPKPGHLAFVAQSGSIVGTVLDWAATRGIGFSHFVALGTMSDVDFGDLLDYFAGEGDVRGVLLFMETVGDARKFMSAARAASRLKPVVVAKAGRFDVSARAVSAHTGAVAGRDAVYDAAFRRAGMLRVHDIGDLFGAVETLALGRIARGDRLAILTNGGGLGVIATDALAEAGGRLAPLAPETLAALDRFLPSDWSHGNPVDVLSDAPGDRYGRAVQALLADPTTDAVLVIHSPNAIVDGRDPARAVINAAKGRSRCLLTCWMGENAPREARRLFTEENVPTFSTPEAAVRAFLQMVNYRRNQDSLTQTPPSIAEDLATDPERAQAVVDRAIAAGRSRLTEDEIVDLLAAYDIPWASSERSARSGEVFELMIGVSDDAQFGPIITVGQGGVAGAVIEDLAVALPPLNLHLAHEAVGRTRVARLIQGRSAEGASTLGAVATTLVKVSQLVIDLGAVIDLRLDPVFVDDRGVAVGSAAISVEARATPAHRRLAIRPYPKELEQRITLPDGRAFLLRPVLPEDEPEFQAFFSRLSPEDVRLRFFAPKKALSHPMAARLTQIDYDREMALVLAEPAPPGRSAIFGAVHLNADANGERAEYSIMLQSDMAGMGFGPLLMRRIIDYAKRRGLREIFGEVLRENRPMLRVCELFRFERQISADDPGAIEVRLRL